MRTHVDVNPARAAQSEEAAASLDFDDCLSHPDQAYATHAALERAHSEHDLMIDGRPLCRVLRPRFLSARHYAHLAYDSQVLARLFERAGEHLLASDRLLDLVGASEQEREIWSIDPGYPGFTLTSRLDSFMVDDDVKFLEYNAESPAGIGFCDRLTETFNDLEVTRTWRGDGPPARAEARRRLLDTLHAAYRSWGGSDKPSIAIIDWDTVITRRDFALCAEFFRQHGIDVTITDPRKLEYRQGKLWAGCQHITLVYRRVLLHELLDKATEADQLLSAYREGAACMVNSPRSKLLHKKSLFALLSEGSLELELTPAEQAVVDATIPWTRRLTTGKTAYRDQRVDLRGLLLDHPDRFTIKPVDDYGGRGVVLGWEAESEEWSATINNGLGGGYIVQERVDVPQENYPIWEGGELRHVSLWLDTDPLLFGGEVGAVLTRLSGSALLNVTAGSGSTTPTFTLRNEGG